MRRRLRQGAAAWLLDVELRQGRLRPRQVHGLRHGQLRGQPTAAPTYRVHGAATPPLLRTAPPLLRTATPPAAAARASTARVTRAAAARAAAAARCGERAAAVP